MVQLMSIVLELLGSWDESKDTTWLAGQPQLARGIMPIVESITEIPEGCNVFHTTKFYDRDMDDCIVLVRINHDR